MTWPFDRSVSVASRRRHHDQGRLEETTPTSSDMDVYVWEYRVRPETVERFREVYGPDGAWVAVFRRASGCVGAELYRDLDDPYR